VHVIKKDQEPVEDPDRYDRDENGGRLYHYGIKRKSGRYPWGSGDTPYTRAVSFQNEMKKARASGMSDTQIAQGWGMTTSELRATVSVAKQERKAEQIAMATKLKYDKGMSNVAIGKRMGLPESTVRELLKPEAKEKNDILTRTTAVLREQVERKKYLDVGKGVELHMNISYQKLKDAVGLLKDEGYELHYVKIEQLGTGKQTSVKVLAAPGTEYRETYKNRGLIQPPMIKSSDGGRSYDVPMPPVSISSKRVKVRYAEEGGTDADGVIYVRSGVKDLSLGGKRYAQVRIAVDGTHYLKGMALLRDDLPPGADLVFNTNKSNTGNKLDAMKPMKRDKVTGEIDRDDPFGASISRQIREMGSDGKERLSSVMNIVNEEGRWGEWSKSLSSQMLSKQPPSLARHQLDLAYENKLTEFRRIMELENPTVRRHLLSKFSEGADASAVHLKAAALPRQASHVILPINTMKQTEVYAPNYRDGERVALIRYPHGGKFEIPELVVNNRHPEAKRILGNAPDAIGIHHKVAERLSGADFDGDTVLVIPNNSGKVKSEPALEGLKGFDPQRDYKGYEGMPEMSSKTKAMQMGLVSNLITDMTIKGAPNDEIARAVRHSMVVIDAEKHKLDWRRSARDNGIAQLMKKYQKSSQGGASTIVSAASSEARVLDRKPRSSKEGGPIDKKTGKKVYVETGAEYYTGKKKYEKSTKLAEADDAHTLSSGTKIEHIYAEHSNRLKKLGNEARLAMLAAQDIEYSPSAAKVYAEEVKKLDADLRLAKRNAPLERYAQVVANASFRMKKEASPDMDTAEIKKLKGKELQNARNRVGARKNLIEITPRQWEAIQAGAITKTKLDEILQNADIEKVRELATPKDKPKISTADLNRAILMLRNDKYSIADIADQLGVSTSTLRQAIDSGGV
jgi:DNA-binding Lrp family transcriptional regulator